MLRLVRVRGSSMAPTLEDGDLLVVLTRGRPRPGDVVVARHRDLGLIVKRIIRIGASGSLALAGDNLLSVDSAGIGRIRPDAVLGRALFRLDRGGRPRLLPPRRSP
ncbi:S24/S26 family peptidase [Zavarzinia compransoris]|nr:S24/S26 family peptidase [Zavarzinia compransoris]TDP48291.1 peptidase S24-like protein [Zavarzinia compransoris]